MEDFLLRVSWSRSPNQMIRQGEVTADIGLSCPEPPPTNEEMLQVVYAAKIALLKLIRKRKAKK